MPVTLVLASDEWFLGGEANAPWEARGRGGRLAHDDAIARLEARHGIDQLERAAQCRGCLLDSTALHGSGVQDADATGAQEWQAELDGNGWWGESAGHSDAVALAALVHGVLLGPEIAHLYALGQTRRVNHLLEMLAALGATIQQRAGQIRAREQEWHAGKPGPGADIDEWPCLIQEQRQGAQCIVNVCCERFGLGGCDQTLRCRCDEVEKDGEWILFHVKRRPHRSSRFT